MARALRNIWVAAGDGDLDRVRELIEQHCESPSSPEYIRSSIKKPHLAVSPNGPDANSYTPMHAAASYGHIDILNYLISHGGDVNITDDDGDTPLYTVENVETARFLVEHGAIVDRQNNEGISPVEHLNEDFGQIAHYLQSVTNASGSIVPGTNQPSQHSQNIASEHLTSNLMASVQEIMERAQADGRDPEDELKQAVGRVVLEGVVTGYEMSIDDDGLRSRAPSTVNGTDSKRPRTDDGP